MIDRVDGDVDCLAALTLNHQGQNIATNASEIAALLLVGRRQQHGRLVRCELEQRLGQDNNQRCRTVADRGHITGAGANGGDCSRGNQHVAKALFAYGDEVGAERNNSTASGASAAAANGNGPAAFGQVNQDAEKGCVLFGLPFEPSLAGPFSGRGVDKTLGNPCIQTL
jgi:hypothetical protein